VNHLTDQQLLRDYAGCRSDAAFAELVRRHVDIVFSAALRMVCDAHLAEDVTQSVFIALAQNAKHLTERSVLSGWLHRTAQNLAANVVRSDVRRRAREQEAVIMNELHEPDIDWEQIAPHLDIALEELDETDRDALLLRYFERKSAHEMAQILGTSEDAAQKRVSRAVERLREFFSKRKVTIGAGGLVVLISANAVQAAPTGLAAAISAAAVLAGTAIQTSTIIAATKTIAMTTLQKTFIAFTVFAAVGAAIYAVQLQNQIHSLRQQQTSLNEQIQQLQQERDDAKNQLEALQQENEQLRANDIELLRLRGEVTRLRQQRNVSLTAAQSETNNLPSEEKTYINLVAKFVSFPTEDLQALGVSWMSDAHGGKTGLLTEQQFKTINEAMQGASDVNLISKPRILTLNGMEARFSVTRAFPVGGTNANVGSILDVTPYFSTNSSTFVLNLNAELNQLIGDPSQPDVQTIQATNQATLSPGQTVVLEREIPSDGWLPDSTNTTTGPRSLLVFVTPEILSPHDLQPFPQRFVPAVPVRDPTNQPLEQPSQ
jgi:RNA polymerase sigma factor (sigma-70 family)